MNGSIKSWATPLAIGAFLISAVTGVLIFFDIEMGAIEPVHKWLSWFLLGGVSLHIVANWRLFSGYFIKKPSLVIIGIAMAVTLGSMLPVFAEREEGGEHNGKFVLKALESSTLETVALVTKTSSETLTGYLQKRGITSVNSAMTVQEIASRNGKSGKEVLSTLLEVSNAAKGVSGGDDEH